MRPGKLGRRITIIAGLLLTFSVVAPQAAHATTAAERSSGWIINRWDRNPRGIHSLALNERVSNIARAHSAEMSRARKIYHSNLRVVGSKIPGWRILGENVGVGPSLVALNQAFMNSPGHRANLLCKCFRYVGIGVYQAHGLYWVTHIFWA